MLKNLSQDLHEESAIYAYRRYTCVETGLFSREPVHSTLSSLSGRAEYLAALMPKYAPFDNQPDLVVETHKLWRARHRADKKRVVSHLVHNLENGIDLPDHRVQCLPLEALLAQYQLVEAHFVAVEVGTAHAGEAHRRIGPSTGTRQEPHISVLSATVEFRLTTRVLDYEQNQAPPRGIQLITCSLHRRAIEARRLLVLNNMPRLFVEGICAYANASGQDYQFLPARCIKMPTFLFEQLIELDMATTLRVVAPGYVENASVLRRRVRAARRASSGQSSGGGAREQGTLVLVERTAGSCRGH